MIEIAIAVGVIAFALIAIIGILPQGMNVQKDNREDTIISQDAPYFLNAIRNGEMRTNNNILTNYVESINITNIAVTPPAFLGGYTNTTLLGIGGSNDLPNDMAIIGLLSTPEFDPRVGPGETNVVTAIVRAMTGSAIQQTGASANMAFRYQLTVEIVPWGYSMPYYTPNYLPSSLTNNPAVLSAYTNYLANHLHEVRLKFSWPVLPNNAIGPGRQTYRSLISSHLGQTNVLGTPLWFFQPQSYTTNISTFSL
jgi:hypothetical protein